MLPEPLIVLKIVTQVFDTLPIPYLVGGSVASSIYGLFRTTNDIDLVADIKLKDIDRLVAALESEFYIDGEMIRDAIQTQTSFNVLHLPSLVKVDVFLFKPSPWKLEEWARRRKEVIGTGEDQITVQLASPEDMILQKLVWYRMGGGVSDRQWGDILGILKVQSDNLDYDYLIRWAAEEELSELLKQILKDADVEK